MTERDLNAIRKSLIPDEAVSNLIWPDFLKEQEVIDNGHYVEDFEEDYSENFEDERKVEIFEQEKEEKKNTINGRDMINVTSLLYKVYPMPEPYNHIFYMKLKPTIAEGDHK